MLRISLLGNQTGQRSIPRHCQVDADPLSEEATSIGYHGPEFTMMAAVSNDER
jgi:hypothetical protein